MEREDIKDLTLSILAVLSAILVVDCICLHVKCARQANELAALSERLELHINPPEPPPEPSFADKAADVYNRVKSAAVKGFEAAKEEYLK